MGNGGNYEIGKWKVNVYHHLLSFNSLLSKGFNKKGHGARWGGAFGSHLNSQKGGT